MFISFTKYQQQHTVRVLALGKRSETLFKRGQLMSKSLWVTEKKEASTVTLNSLVPKFGQTIPSPFPPPNSHVLKNRDFLNRNPVRGGRESKYTPRKGVVSLAIHPVPIWVGLEKLL